APQLFPELQCLFECVGIGFVHGKLKVILFNPLAGYADGCIALRDLLYGNDDLHGSWILPARFDALGMRIGALRSQPVPFFGNPRAASCAISSNSGAPGPCAARASRNMVLQKGQAAPTT